MNKAKLRLDINNEAISMNDYDIPLDILNNTNNSPSSQLIDNILYIGNKYYLNVYDYNKNKIVYIRKCNTIDYVEDLINDNETKEVIYCKQNFNGNMIPIKSEDIKNNFIKQWIFNFRNSKLNLEFTNKSSHNPNEYNGKRDIPITHNQLKSYNIFYYKRYLVEQFDDKLLEEIFSLENIKGIYDPITRILYSSKTIQSLKDKECRVLDTDIDYPISGFITLEEMEKIK